MLILLDGNTCLHSRLILCCEKFTTVSTLTVHFRAHGRGVGQIAAHTVSECYANQIPSAGYPSLHLVCKLTARTKGGEVKSSPGTYHPLA